jgi:hypothetical protein
LIVWTGIFDPFLARLGRILKFRRIMGKTSFGEHEVLPDLVMDVIFEDGVYLFSTDSWHA